ncbi:hypothetical protein PsorP6_008073 [Peronosclerospora sorghi]|uniref:Uncharacterized protein n=1 Tax=Peronosclerospora sorghi TaxID=230839 RepID=A0ACC0W9F1_9STRA|nr:hypothetical protein PsorP6_008073 [Peronosclerospora sorghi]
MTKAPSRDLGVERTLVIGNAVDDLINQETFLLQFMRRTTKSLAPEHPRRSKRGQNGFSFDHVLETDRSDLTVDENVTSSVWLLEVATFHCEPTRFQRIQPTNVSVAAVHGTTKLAVRFNSPVHDASASFDSY